MMCNLSFLLALLLIVNVWSANKDKPHSHQGTLKVAIFSHIFTIQLTEYQAHYNHITIT